MKLRLMGDFTKLAINGLMVVQGLPRIEGFVFIDMEFDDLDKRITAFRVDGVDFLPDSESTPIFLPNI
jgi:hypothetical protein